MAGRFSRHLGHLGTRRHRPHGIACGGRTTVGGAEMNSGLEGIVAAETVLSHSDGETGTIWLRGHTVEDLVKNQGYEGTVAILWEGFVGEGLTRTKIQNDFGAARERAFAQLGEWLGAAGKRPVLEGLRIALAALPE